VAGKPKKESEPQRVGLREALANIEKAYGRGVVLPGSQARFALNITRIPTGIFTLDFALAGGIPARRVSMFSGRKGSGKTTTALKALANWQQLCSRCLTPWRRTEDQRDPVAPCCANPMQQMAAWIDLEGVFDPEWAERCGVEMVARDGTERIYVTRPSYAEEAIDIATGLIRVAEVGFMVVDSIAALVPRAEVEESANQKFMGQQAVLVNRFVRDVVGGMNAGLRDAPTLILINQVRQKITGFTQPSEVEPGGMGQIFAASVVVRMRRVEYDFGGRSADSPEVAKALKATSRFKVEFSKVGPPGATGEFTIVVQDHEAEGRPWRQGEMDDLEAVLTQAQAEGLLVRVGAAWEYMGAVIAKTKDEVEQRWAADPALLQRVRRDVIATCYRGKMV
jgi:recombination protein RecA